MGMTAQKIRETTDYKEAMRKIRDYRKGFHFTIDFSRIPPAEAGAMRILLRDAETSWLIESVSVGIALNGEVAEETYVRI